MSKLTASIREVRTDFRSFKRKKEAHGKIVITDNGVPSYVIKPLPRPRAKRGPMPDYYGRLIKLRARPLSAAQARRLHEENRGDR
jgi:antitoxin (DNA-binding transcriptional repressor) of toxin-antitoxin stability system